LVRRQGWMESFHSGFEGVWLKMVRAERFQEENIGSRSGMSWLRKNPSNPLVPISPHCFHLLTQVLPPIHTPNRSNSSLYLPLLCSDSPAPCTTSKLRKRGEKSKSPCLWPSPEQIPREIVRSRNPDLIRATTIGKWSISVGQINSRRLFEKPTEEK
jgi:hypothetical protein